MKIGSMLALGLLAVAAASVAAKADDQQGKQACMMDALTICAQFIPDRDRVANCLISNRSRISVPCRAQLANWHG